MARVSSDLALARDPAYRQLVEEFAANRGNFETEFAHAWYLSIDIYRSTQNIYS